MNLRRVCATLVVGIVSLTGTVFAGGACNALFEFPDDFPISRVFMAEYGNKSGPVVLLLHGLDSDHTTFDGIRARLGEKFRVISYDQRGMGGSAEISQDYSTDAQARDVIRVMDHFGVSKAYLVAHSMGGRIATRVAQRFPDRVAALVIEDMDLVPRPKMDESQIERAVARIRSQFGENNTYRSFEELVKALSFIYRDQSQTVAHNRSVRNPDETYSLTFRPWVNLRYGMQLIREDLREAMLQTRAPVLVIRADPSLTFAKGSLEGTQITPEGLAFYQTEAPWVRIVTIEGARHDVHNSQRDAYLDQLFRFLESVDRPEPSTGP